MHYCIWKHIKIMNKEITRVRKSKVYFFTAIHPIQKKKSLFRGDEKKLILIFRNLFINRSLIETILPIGIPSGKHLLILK